MLHERIKTMDPDRDIQVPRNRAGLSQRRSRQKTTDVDKN